MEALAALPNEYSQEEFAAAPENCAFSATTPEYHGGHGVHADYSGFNRVGEKQVRGGELFTLLRKRWLVLDQNI